MSYATAGFSGADVQKVGDYLRVLHVGTRPHGLVAWPRLLDAFELQSGCYQRVEPLADGSSEPRCFEFREKLCKPGLLISDGS